MSTNIVVLSGSPRKNGTTERLIKEFTSGAIESGKTVTEFRVADLSIAPCKACMHCFQHNGECVYKDDMPLILEALRKADALLLVSPIYYWSVTAQLKTAIDRFYSSFSAPLSIKRSGLILTCGNDNAEAAFESSIAMYKRIVWFQKWDDAGIVSANSVHSPEQLDGRAELKLANELGRNI